MPYKPRIQVCVKCGKEYLAKDHRVLHCSRSCALGGDKSYLWKGDNVGIDALHSYMRKHVPNNKTCNKCGESKKLDLANISGDYKRDVSDWEWLCRKCHMKSDGRLDAFLSHSAKRRLPNMKCKQCDTEFWPHSVKSMFCSNSCKMTFFNLNIKKYKNERKN